MHCKACNFIVKGKEDKCPYCGTVFEEDKLFNKRINFFGWLHISLRQVLLILAINLIFLVIVADILGYYLHKVELHITPWAFLGIFGFYFILTTFISPANEKSRFSFIKSNALFITYSLLMLGSYYNDNLFGFNKDPFTLLFGYFYPLMLSGIMLLGILRFIIFRHANLFSAFFYIAYVLAFLSIILILSFIPNLGIYNDLYAKIIIYISCAFNVFVLINLIAITTMRVKSNIIKEA